MLSLSGKQIKRAVRKTKRMYGLSTNTTVDEIKRALKKLGYDFYTFESGKEEIGKYNLSGWTHYPCFSVTKEEIRAVFINSHKSEFETLILLAHELGHIVLNHYTSRRNLSKDLQEHEANQFAILLLKTPNPYTTYIRMFSCCCGVLTLCLLVYMFAPKKTDSITQNNQQVTEQQIQTENKTVVQNYIVPAPSGSNNKTGTSGNISSPSNNAVQQPVQTGQEPSAPVVAASKQEVNQSEMVVVTTTGKKYHKPTCGHVKNRETRSLTVNEAVQQGFSACLNCFR